VSFHTAYHMAGRSLLLLFLIRIVGGGVELGPLGTAATTRPTVPTPGDYEVGEFGGTMMVGEAEVLGENLPQCHSVHKNPT
jgi:hypothetical protein